jgi:hypothetical protein
MTQELKTLRGRYYVAKSQRTKDGLPWIYSLDAWLEAYLAQVPEGADPEKCRVRYNEDGTFDVTPTRGGRGQRRVGKKAQPIKRRDPIERAIETAVYVSAVLEEAAVDLSELDEAVEELLK